MDLPIEFKAKLANARIAGTGYLCESRVVDVPARVSELRMVEYVEEFDPKVESEVLMDHSSLRYTEVCVVESGSMEEASV